MKKNIFERVEKKYLASPEQCRAFLELAEGRLLPDPGLPSTQSATCTMIRTGTT